MAFTIATRLAFFLLIIIASDIWSIRALRLAFSPKSKFPRRLILSTTIFFLLSGILVFLIYGMPGLDPEKLRAYYLLATLFFVIFVPKLALAAPVLLEDILVLLFRSLRRIFSTRPRYTENRKWERISLLVWPAMIASAFLFIFILEGVLIRKHHWQVRTVEVEVPGLPDAFEGYRILQFSDTHLGSFYSEKAVRKGLGLIGTAKPDLIVFTGDLVNSSVAEALPYTHLFKQLSASDGKMAVLGNHDMDDFMKWTEEMASEESIRGIENFYRDAGFHLLRNSSKAIVKDFDTLFIAGVDNWGLPPFRQYGRLGAALQNTSPGHPVVLLSHDPSHWRQEVIGNSEIILTLSGHTHAMQFGVRGDTYQWSPAAWKYPEFLGLYREGNQYLHVNPGFGYIGFMMRAGIAPELSLIVLRKAG
jgi:uncharacterized protein